MLKFSYIKVLLFTLFSTLFFSYTWINSFYISTRNADFEKYYDYINYFTGINVDIDYGQGVLYYFLIAKRLTSKVDIVNLSNSEFIVSAAVHEVNFIFFLIGLAGFFFFLKEKNFKTESIIISFIILFFFPQTIYLRSVMKPEIIAFAFTPWLLTYIERYFEHRNIKNLFYAIPFISLIINSKASTAGMLGLYLIFSYYKIFKTIKIKNFILLLVTFVCVISLIQFENYSISGNSFIERPYDEEYDFKADPKIIFNTNLNELVRNPFFTIKENGETYHSRSVINIILLDTFGDYFNQLFDDQVNYFSKHRKNLFVDSNESTFIENREIKYKGPYSWFLINDLNRVRKLVSLFFSLIFYLSILYFSFKDKKNKKYYLAPLAGLVVLYVNSLGIPSNNFNPIKADTFKTFYFSSLLCVSLLFILVKIFRKINFFKIFVLIIFVSGFLFISGHPRENNQNLSEHLVYANQFNPFCSINNFLIFENNILKSIFPSGNINNLKSDCTKKSNFTDNYKQRSDHDKQNLNKCIDKDNVIINNSYNESTSNLSECRIYALEQLKNENNLIVPKLPFLSLLTSMVCIIFIIYEIRLFFRKKRKNV